MITVTVLALFPSPLIKTITCFHISVCLLFNATINWWMWNSKILNLIPSGCPQHIYQQGTELMLCSAGDSDSRCVGARMPYPSQTVADVGVLPKTHFGAFVAHRFHAQTHDSFRAAPPWLSPLAPTSTSLSRPGTHGTTYSIQSASARLNRFSLCLCEKRASGLCT